MAWAAGTPESFVQLTLEYKDETGELPFKQELLLLAVGNDTTVLDNAQIAAFITHLEVISNTQVSKAEVRSVALTPFTNSSPKTAGSTVYPTVDNVAYLPFVAVNPLIPSKAVSKTVGIPAPVAGKLIGSGSNLGAFSGTDSDSVGVLAFLNRYLAFKYVGNGLYYGNLSFVAQDFELVSIPRIIGQ